MASLFLFFSLTFVTAQNNASTDTLKTGEDAPTFSLPNLNNKYVFLRDYCGEKLRKPWINKTRHVVVLSFFATWCGPCKKEIPYLEKLMKQYKGKPVKFYLIDVGEDPQKVTPFVKANNVKIPVLIDRYNQTAQKYGAIALPRLVIIDKNGKVVKLKRGFKNGELFLSEMREIIQPLLKK
jgi:thiol-disulfide isomerase/thioredoxin